MTNLKLPKKTLTSVTLLYVLFASIINLVSAQSTFEEDSTRLAELMPVVEQYYKYPVVGKKNTIEAYSLINKLVDEYPNNKLLREQRITITDAYLGFMRRNLNYEESLKLALQNKEERLLFSDSCQLALSYKELYTIWYANKDYHKAKENLDRALELAELCNDFDVPLRIKSLYIQYNIRSKEYDKALELALEAHKVAKREKIQGAIANTAYLLYNCYSLKKKPSEGLHYLKLADEGYKKIGSITGQEKVNAAFGTYHRKYGNPKKAVDYYKNAIEFNLKTQDSSRLMYRFLGLSNTYVKLGDYKNAYLQHLNYVGTKKRIDNRKNFRKLVEFEAQIAFDKQKTIDSLKFVQQKKIDEEILKHNANKRFGFFILGFVIVLAIAVIGYIINKQRLKNQVYENILLNKKVVSKSEEIKLLFTETIKQIRSKEKIEQGLKDISKDSENDKIVDLNNILIELRASKLDDEKLKIFNENIQEVSYAFIQKLKNKHPELSKTEIEVCSFISMGLSRKEIASIRGTSDYAVKTMRSRIRKKLSLDSSITLDTYLQAFS